MTTHTSGALPAPAQVHSAMLQHANMQADSVFASAFRTNMITQHMNQQLWDEHQQLSRRVSRRQDAQARQSRWMPRWSGLFQQDDEAMLEMLGKQIHTNNRVIEWCQRHMQRHLQLSDRQRRDLDRMLRSSRPRGWGAFLKESLVSVLQLGGIAALIYVAHDHYSNGSRAWNAVMAALGRHDLKLQRLLPQRVLDWLRTKLVRAGVGETTVQDRFFAAMLKAVRSRCNTVACRWLGLGAGGIEPPADDPFEWRPATVSRLRRRKNEWVLAAAPGA